MEIDITEIAITESDLIFEIDVRESVRTVITVINLKNHLPLLYLN